MFWIQVVISVAQLLISFLTIRKMPAAWLAAAVLEVAFIAYNITTRQYPFAVTAVFFLCRDLYGWWRWRKDDHERAASAAA